MTCKDKVLPLYFGPYHAQLASVRPIRLEVGAAMASGITRGTTPIIAVTVPMDLTGYTCYLTIGKVPGEPYVTIGNDQMTAEYGEITKLTFSLTQEQTLDCAAGDAYIQLRMIDNVSALASSMGAIEIFDVLRGGVIVDVN